MLLQDKVAVVHGAGGVIGGAIARAFAREGATVHLAGRTRAKLEAVARDIGGAGGTAHVAVLDALDEVAVSDHAAGIAADIACNAIGVLHVQGTALLDLSLPDFEQPIHDYLRAHFLTARAAARSMIAQRSGVLLTISTQAARLAFPGVLGFGSACAAIEGFTRHLAAEVGPHGVRAICLRSDALPEALALGSHSRAVFEPVAAQQGKTVEAMLGGESSGLLKRFPRVAEVANAAVFAASAHGGALTGTTLNLTCGASVD